MTINSIPDTVLLEIFAFRLSSANHTVTWQRLVKVCQRWQEIIYGSPRYLDLHYDCSNEKPFKNLSRWPEFPLALHYNISHHHKECDDLIAALKQPGRVHRVDLVVQHLDAGVDCVLKHMKVPFPALTDLNNMGPDRDGSYFNIEDYDGVSLPRKFFGKVCSVSTASILRSSECNFLSRVSKTSVVGSWPCFPPSRGYSPELLLARSSIHFIND